MSSAPHRITPLLTGAFRLDGGGMFGLIPKSMWSQWTTPDADNRIALATRSLLVETARDGLVLVEAGCGDKWTDKERAMYALERRTAVDALREVGVSPADIAHVVVTHLHFDHAGGLTLAADGGPVPTFPRARVHVQRIEWHDALANKSTMTRTYLRTHLDPIASQVELHDGEQMLIAIQLDVHYRHIAALEIDHDAPHTARVVHAEQLSSTQAAVVGTATTTSSGLLSIVPTPEVTVQRWPRRLR
jgi:glyoxylase-like metal-dependent hydrolase (beta-lactamase superfamily II)